MKATQNGWSAAVYLVWAAIPQRAWIGRWWPGSLA